MKRYALTYSFSLVASCLLLGACSDRGLELNNTTTGAVLGTAMGAGLGAIVGNQTGHPGAGVAIGAGAGALTGAMVGSQGDRSRERADDQEERLRRQERELERQRRELEELRGGRQSDDSSRGSRYDRRRDDSRDDFSR